MSRWLRVQLLLDDKKIKKIKPHTAAVFNKLSVGVLNVCQVIKINIVLNELPHGLCILKNLA